VILIGTAVNNAILIVHQSLNYMNERGDSPRDAILESVRTRIRPIFMTTTTTVFGLLPLVLMPGAGSELYRGLGAVVLGGLVVSTLFTLILVPTMFSLLLDLAHYLFPAEQPERDSDVIEQATIRREPRVAAVSK
jgi:hydrophobic/amphiphilic exporter-1 (mainly G- bacteria), HAE1 family